MASAQAISERRIGALGLGAAVCLGVAASLARFFASVPDAGIPQFATGGDVLSVAFGDAKDTISVAMSAKANDYFHGGVEADCNHLGEHRHDHDLDEGHEAEEGHEAGHHHDHDGDECPICGHHHHEDHCNGDEFDPWAWINKRIAAPSVHRHLSVEKAIELLPFYWAAVRANPRNVSAWTDAWHVAFNIMGDKALARRILAQAREVNPSNLEIEFCDARTVYDKGKGDIAEAKRAFERARSVALKNCSGDIDSLNDSDRHLYNFVVNYISKCEKTLNSAK